MALDVEFVRQHFPALAGDWIFFDNAGGSQIAQPVLDRINEYLVDSNVQLGATYDVSARATERVYEARRSMARYVNARDDGEVLMGPSTSMLLRVLANALASDFVPGDEVIVTDCDHEANIGPWVELEQRGINVKTWHVNSDTLRMESVDLRALLSERTRLVAVTHASNILGTINPIREFADIAHDAGALLCVDGVAFAPHRQVDVQAFDADFYAFSFYKTYGPHYAVLCGRHELLLGAPGINHFFIPQDDVPHKFQPGNVNYELSYGMTGLTDYLELLSQHHDNCGVSGVFDRVAHHEAKLATRFLDFLASKSTVRVIGDPGADPDVRVPTISFVVEGTASDEVPPIADAHHIGIRWGDFYARRLIDNLGLSEQNGVVRVSMVHYNTSDEIDKLISVLDPVI